MKRGSATCRRGRRRLLEPVPRTIVLAAGHGRGSGFPGRSRGALLREDPASRSPRAPRRLVSDQLAHAAVARAQPATQRRSSRLEEGVNAGTLDSDLGRAGTRKQWAGGNAATRRRCSRNRPDRLGLPQLPRSRAVAKRKRRRAALKKLRRIPIRWCGRRPARRARPLGCLRRARRLVDRMLQSEVPDLRLMAAEAWDGKTRSLDNRHRAAARQPRRDIRLERPVSSPGRSGGGAQGVERRCCGHQPSGYRAEAARIMEETALSRTGILDVGQARRPLRESDAPPRLHAAGVLLAAAQRRPL